jgi:hypothetical protein
MKTGTRAVPLVTAVMEGVLKTVLDAAKAWYYGWKATIRLMLFDRKTYKFLKNVTINAEDLVEVPNFDTDCVHDGPKYYLMYGEEVCRLCNEWTGRIEGIDK